MFARKCENEMLIMNPIKNVMYIDFRSFMSVQKEGIEQI